MTHPILHRQTGSWSNIASYAPAKPDLYASLAAVTLPPKGGAMLQAARAADASHSSLLRVSTIGGIAIAAFALLYFGGELLRAVLS